MARTRYCVPEDVARRAFGGTTGRQGQTDVATALDANELLGTQDDRETIQARIEAVESQWDRDATPMRAVSVGSSSVPKKYDAKGTPWPINIYLDHQNVAPLDPNGGDFIATRTGRDQYTDITNQEGSAWTADYDKGVITVYRYPGAGQLPAFYQIRDQFVQISYQIAAGGDFASAGQSTLSSTLSQGQTGTVSVANADRLPRSDETMLIGGSEYVEVRDVDHENDEIEIVSRGVRYTDDVEHASGTTIHFCPLDVRDAVAAMGAVELLRTDAFTEAAYDGDLDVSDKTEQWTDEYESAVGRYTDARGYK